MSEPKDMFAADVMCHKPCINNYIQVYKREVNDTIEQTETVSAEVHAAFENMVKELNLDDNGYTLSECRLNVNKNLDEENQITNRRLKKLFVDKFGEDICFTYPRDKSKSQMIFSRVISTDQLVEKVRTTDSLKVCAGILRDECKEFDYKLSEKICDSESLSNSIEEYTVRPPESWMIFLDSLIPSHAKSPQVKRKCSSIFHIVYTLLHDGRKKTPMHVGLAQTIHETTRSKTLIQLCNRLGLCMGYEQVERLDNMLMNRIVSRADGHRLPLPPSVTTAAPIRGAMDNFDHEEDTASGIGGSHDTVLVIFQDKVDNITDHISDPEDMELSSNTNDKRRVQVLDCQKRLPSGKPNRRGIIATDYEPIDRPCNLSSIDCARVSDMTWTIGRFFTGDITPNRSLPVQSPVPTWSAFNSLISSDEAAPTAIGYTPILPYPATDYDTIFTCMVNFQDALLQTGQTCSSLWCDESVYSTARELQLLLPNERLGNIFLGLGGFHMAKVLLSCIGKYLKDSGTEQLFVENEIFGPVIVDSILKGSHYARAMHGITMLAEVMQRLQLLEFINQHDMDTYNELIDGVESLQSACKARDETEARLSFEKCTNSIDTFKVDLEAFVQQGVANSSSFKYWNQFISVLVPLLRDLTRSHREGNWELFISALGRSLPVFFAFDKTHYSRWGSVFYEDCLQLPQSFPTILSDFLNGHFVVRQTKRKFSNVPMDQALEQMYNKPAKGRGGIIGITRRKEAVAQHDLVKHEKAQISQLMRHYCELDDEDEYSLHHEFSDATTTRDEQSIQQMLHYVLERGNPFDVSGDGSMKNFVTGTQADSQRCKFLFEFTKDGEEAYQNFFTTRFKDKTKQLLDPIPKLHRKGKTAKVLSINIQKETQDAIRYIDIARSRRYDIAQLLKFELTSTSLNLTKDGYLRKSPKSELQREIEKNLGASTQLPDVYASDVDETAVIVDFMAYSRSVRVKLLKIRTFGDMAINVWGRITKIACPAKRIDIVFDIYEPGGVKDFERLRRSKSDPVEVTIQRDDTQLMVDMDSFWASTGNKRRWETFFSKWVIKRELEHTDSRHVVFIGGCHDDDVWKCVEIDSGTVADVPYLHSHHDEADDRILLHVSHAVTSGSCRRIVVASPDTDVFVCLLYHFNCTWKHLGLVELWLMCGQGKTSRAVPLHELNEKLNGDMVDVLPAIHSLSGCDYTSKVSTKHAVLKLASSSGPELLKEFGKTELTDGILSDAENFLVRAVSGDNKYDKFDDLRYHQCHHMKISNNFERLAPTSTSIRFHIQRAYFQCHRWLCAPIRPETTLDPTHLILQPLY